VAVGPKAKALTALTIRVKPFDIHLIAISDAISVASCTADDIEIPAPRVLIALDRREILSE
jgi:hypothetical protein